MFFEKIGNDFPSGRSSQHFICHEKLFSGSRISGTKKEVRGYFFVIFSIAKYYGYPVTVTFSKTHGSYPPEFL